MTNHYLWNRIAGPDPALRAADADRERVGDRLRQSHAEGRLDMAEFQQRLERCYRAKTIGELGELVRDLPRQEAPEERQSLGWLRAGRWALSPLALILVVLMVASAASRHHVLWLWIPLVFLFCRMSWWRRRRWLASARREPGEWI